MLSTTLKINLTGSMMALGKQTDFAAASALTLTAKEIQTAEIAATDAAFTIRNDWNKRGPLAIKVKAAAKQNLEAWVGTGFEELTKFVEQPAGSFVVKLPRGQFIAVPTSNVKRTKREIIRAAQRPRNLRGKRDIVLPMRNGRGMVLFQERGRGRAAKRVALYILVPRVKVKEVDVLFGPAQKVFVNRFPAIFAQQAEKALATAR